MARVNPARSLTLAVALLLGFAAPAAARDAAVTSFDGTQLQVSLHPAAGLKPGQRAPTILQTHGWGGSRDTNPDSPSSDATGNVGTGPLRNAGFNVLTWDSRGFGQSGGTVTVDSKDNEGRDVSRAARLARQAARGAARQEGRPARRHDTASPTRAGSSSWRRGIDKRIDAIAPTSPGTRCSRASTRTRPSRAAGRRCSYAAGVPTGPPRPAHPVGVHQRRDHRHAVAPRTAPGSSRAGRATTSWSKIRVPTLLRPGHGRHAVHARRGDPQLRDPRSPQRAAEDDVVLRRPRRVPHRHRARRPLPGRRDRLAAALRGAARRRSTPGPASSGWPTTPYWRRLVPLAAAVAARRSSPPAPARWPSTRPTRSPARRSPPGRAANAVNVADPATATAQIGRRAEAEAHLLGHRHRRPTCSPRSSTRSATSCSATRSRRSR